MDISLIGSSVRHHLWIEFMDSLTSNSCEYEVVFAGNLDGYQTRGYLKKYKNLKYIHTGDIPPAQCYEVARINAKGRLIMWVADDCEFSPELLDKTIMKFNELNNKKLLLSLRTNENNTNNDLENHRFFGSNVNTPLMAPLGVMSREYLEELGGFDSRYLCGQYENDVAMRVYADGGVVEKYEDVCVNIEHLVKHGGGTKFWTGYNWDRQVLEDTWVIGGYKEPMKPLPVFSPSSPGGFKYYYPIENRRVVYKPLLPFVPYKDEGLTITNQCPKEWK